MGQACYHLSLDVGMHQRLQDSGMLSNLVHMARISPSHHVREVYAAALCAMCANEANLSAVRGVNGLSALFELLRDPHTA
eukprot:8179507-Prorocentrum_lima.AAC.1